MNGRHHRFWIAASLVACCTTVIAQVDSADLEDMTVEELSDQCRDYLYGRGVEVDYQRAFELCSIAAQRGFSPALAVLGRMYYVGIHVEKDLGMALHYFLRAAENGQRHSQAAAGMMLLFEREVQNIPEGCRWVVTAADRGHEVAIDMLETADNMLAETAIGDAPRSCRELLQRIREEESRRVPAVIG